MGNEKPALSGVLAKVFQYRFCVFYGVLFWGVAGKTALAAMKIYRSLAQALVFIYKSIGRQTFRQSGLSYPKPFKQIPARACRAKPHEHVYTRHPWRWISASRRI